MNRLKFHALFVFISLALILSPSSAQAAGSGAFIAIYNSGRALVKEVRVVTLPKGLASVVIKDIPSTIDPTSVRVMARDMIVYDLQYSYTPITTKNLLDKYVGKELTVIMPDPADANARILRKARLVANVDRPIFLVGSEVYIGNYVALLLPELPKELETEPTLTLTTENGDAGKKDVALHYLMGGLTWRTDYTLTVGDKGDTATIDAWATLTNTSGSGFQSADVRLVAGNVKRAAAPRGNLRVKSMMAMEADVAASPQPAGESFAQYHVYDIGRPISLAPNGTKQISLFSASKVEVEQELVSRFHTGGGQRSGVIKQGVELALKFSNTVVNNLGRPMPGGLVRVFMPTSDGTQLLAGESGISHIEKGGDVRLSLGQSFDLKVERKQTYYSRIGKNSAEIGWQITVRNGKDTPQKLKLRDVLPGQWEVLKADLTYTRVDSGTIEFDLDAIPPTKDGQGVVINYTVQISY